MQFICYRNLKVIEVEAVIIKVEVRTLLRSHNVEKVTYTVSI